MPVVSIVVVIVVCSCKVFVIVFVIAIVFVIVIVVIVDPSASGLKVWPVLYASDVDPAAPLGLAIVCNFCVHLHTLLSGQCNCRLRAWSRRIRT